VPPGAPAPVAEWWERWVARLIDNIIFVVVFYILLSIFNRIFAPSLEDLLRDPSQSVFLPAFLAGIVAYGAYAAYDYVLHSKDGQTLGKKIMKIRVVGQGGAPIDSSTWMKRSALYPGVMALSGIMYLNWIVGVYAIVLGVLIITDQPLHQGFHDKFVRTVVVKDPR